MPSALSVYRLRKFVATQARAVDQILAGMFTPNDAGLLVPQPGFTRDWLDLLHDGTAIVAGESMAMFDTWADEMGVTPRISGDEFPRRWVDNAGMSVLAASPGEQFAKARRSADLIVKDASRRLIVSSASESGLVVARTTAPAGGCDKCQSQAHRRAVKPDADFTDYHPHCGCQPVPVRDDVDIDNDKIKGNPTGPEERPSLQDLEADGLVAHDLSLLKFEHEREAARRGRDDLGWRNLRSIMARADAFKGQGFRTPDLAADVDGVTQLWECKQCANEGGILAYVRKAATQADRSLILLHGPLHHALAQQLADQALRTYGMLEVVVFSRTSQGYVRAT